MRTPEAFPAELKRRRLEQSLTQAELAGLADMTQAHIAKIEAGASGVSLVNLCRLAEALGCDLDALVPKRGAA